VSFVAHVVEAAAVDRDDVFLEEDDLGEVEVVDCGEEGVLFREVVEHPEVLVGQQGESRGGVVEAA